MSCRCYIYLISICYKDEALLGPVVIQGVRSPHVMRVATSIWSLYATRMKHWWGQWWYRRWGLPMSCGCYIYLVSIHYKDEALVGPVVIQEVRFPHVMQVLHLSDLYTLQAWSIGGASSDTGGEVSSCHAGATSIWISIRFKDGALVGPVVIQEVRSPHVMQVLYLSGLYMLQGWSIGGASSDTGGEVSSCHAGGFIHLVSICYKDEALVGPVVIQQVRSPHVLRVLHPSDFYTLQGWSISGSSSDTGGEVSSCHAGATSIWSLYATRMKHWWGQLWYRRWGLLMSCRCYIYLISIRYKDGALVRPVVIQEVRFPHVMQVLHLSGFYTLQGWSIGVASRDTGGEVSSCHAGATSIWSLYASRMKHWWGQ